MNEHDHSEPPDSLRPALARNVRREGDWPTASLWQWLPVPGGDFGSFPAFGTVDEQGDRRRLANTAITVEQIHAAADRLRAEGLGWIAGVGRGSWSEDDGLRVSAWGATARAAVANLRDGVTALWTEVEMAVFENAAWPGQEMAPGTRLIGDGLVVMAPQPGPSTVLVARHGHTELGIFVGPEDRGSDWPSHLWRFVGEVAPGPAVEILCAAHASAGHADELLFAAGDAPGVAVMVTSAETYFRLMATSAA